MANMKKCKHCNEQIEKDAKVCPKCGGKLGKPIWPIILIAVIAVVLIAVIVGVCVAVLSKPKEDPNEIVLVEHHKSDKSSQYAMYIEGQIKNNKDTPFSFVQVSFTTFDAEGKKIGTCIDLTYDLEAGGTWDFKATCIDKPDKIDHYELKEIKRW